MEQLSLCVNRAGVVRPNVNPMLYISHLCYADGVLLFAGSEKTSARGIKEVLQRFHSLTGLTVNTGKSSIVFAGG